MMPMTISLALAALVIVAAAWSSIQMLTCTVIKSNSVGNNLTATFSQM